MISLADAPYQKCYCEENIHQLVRIFQDLKLDSQFFAVLISNGLKTIPLFGQKEGRGERRLVVWDYHVIAIEQKPGPTEPNLVYDMDTVLEWPQDFEKYWRVTINPDVMFDFDYQRHFRVIPADVYLKIFNSDRKHMQNSDGSWKMPPPTWPRIFEENGEGKTNLMDLIDMEKLIEGTEVLDEIQFFERFRVRK